MLKVGLGQAEGSDTRRVVERAIEDCLKQLQGVAPQAGIIFAGPHFNHRLMLEIINETFPGMGLIGCTTSGNFSSYHGVSEDAITLTLLSSDVLNFSVGAGNGLAADWSGAVDRAISTATSSLHESPSLCLTFPQGYTVPFEQVLERLDTRLGPDCSVFGGLAGNLLGEDSHILQFCGREVFKDGLPILLISGPVEYRYSIANSWKPIGKRSVVTQSANRIVHRIGDFTAVDYYRHYLGYHEEAAREFILAVYQESASEYYIVSPIEYNDDGSISFTGPVPEGSEVQLTETTKDDLISDTLRTGGALRETHSSWEPALSLNFSCGYRKVVLGTSVEEELDGLKQTLQAGLPIVGFFSFGEISPLLPGGPSIVQGATLITLLIGPRSENLPEKGENLQSKSSTTDTAYLSSPDFLKRRLHRSEINRQRLETLKDFTFKMHHRLMDELEEARQEIEEKEELLRESEEKFRRIVQTAGEGFILMDISFSIIDANDAFCTLIGNQRSSVVGRSIMEFTHPEDRQRIESEYRQLLKRKYQRFEARLTARDGRLVPVLVHSNILSEDSGGLIGYMAFFADLTEQKKALALAGEVQKSLLPQENPKIAGLDIAGRNVSCDEVGGDYYDFFFHQDQSVNTFSIAVGDIAGHGVDAALLMSSARAFLRMHSSRDNSIVEIVESMNRQLSEDVQETSRFMTLFYLSIQPDLKTLEWVRAGHDPAILYDPIQNRCEDLKGPGIALGVTPDYQYKAMKKEGLKNGDIIAIGTDGIWETFNEKGDMFGRERFRELLHAHAHQSAAELLNAIFAEVETFRGGRKSEDDLTLVVIKITNP